MKVVNIAIIVLVVAILLFLLFGCMNKPIEAFMPENFEDYIEGTVTTSNVNMSHKEQELFEDLKSNKLSTEEITDLVKGGVLTEKLVEKFLTKLNARVEDKSSDVVTAPSSRESNEDDSGIEGFTDGNTEFAQPL